MTESFPRQQARTRGFSVGVPRDIRVSGDGGRVLYLRPVEAGVADNALWALEVDTGVQRVVVDPAKLASGVDLPEAEKARRERARERGSGLVGYDADEQCRRATFALGGDLFVAEVDSGAVQRYPAAHGVFDPRLQPGGASVAYVAGAELRLADGADDRSVVAEPGAETVTWGSAEFVAAEEMGRSRGHWWNPDGTRLAVQRTDIAAVDEWWIASPVEPQSPPRAIRYPATGTTNAHVGLAVLDLDGGRVDIDWRQGEFEYLAAVAWRDGDRLTLTVQTRDQRTLAVLEADADTGAVIEVHRQHDDHWVELVPGVPRWMGDRLLTVADVDDARRLVLDGAPIGPDDVQIRRVVHTATEADAVWVVATTDPTESHLARIDLEGSLTWLTDQPGVHGGAVGGATAVVTRTGLDHFGTRTEVRGEAGPHTIESFAETPLLEPHVQLLRLGQRELRTALLAPTGHDGSPLPVLLDPYGGPHALRVQAARGLFLTSQWFADQGFLVVVTDGRGTPARGPSWERAVHGDLAAPVLDDQLDALDALAQLDDRADLDRVAIRGWSFGGYLAALAVLRRPDRFHAAIAGAPVTDWRLYDTHYTERYLGHPDFEPEAYERTDLNPLAPQLERPLLLIHGLADDNVVAAHTLQLSRALLEAGRPHQVLPLSGVTHMTPQESVAENLLRLQLDFLRQALGLDEAG
ncbi:MAG: prolyl oligopeptidase family serine peptidase [Acidimicrobiia bacterium]|nr:prolyl oligopeptidase family serine peptidase [Acidimicrobiia bacterium]